MSTAQDAAPRREQVPVEARSGQRAGQLGSSVRIATIAGVEVNVHASWLVIAGLVTWSLATGYFPTAIPGADATVDWLLGALAAILFFASVLAHELAHSILARSRGLDVESITLFIFGGVSNLSGEAKRPGTEFAVAIVGPLTSFAVAIAAYLVAVVFSGTPAIAATAGYLAFINAALGAFNLVPGFPLDGGRVLRSIVWSVTHDLRRATQIASTVGQLVAWGLMLWGFWQVLGGNLLGGIWMIAIGWFLQNAAVVSLQQTVLEARLRRLRVGDVLRPEPTGATPDTSVARLIDGFLLPGARRAVPILDGDTIAGLVTLGDAARVPPERRAAVSAAEIMTPAAALATAAPQTPLQDAIDTLGRGDWEQLPVLEGGRYVGLLTRASVMRALRIREELGLDTALDERPDATATAAG
ncbi:MAG TPA: site-2 protease family protein [Candidatus Limnocylindrales bacterium]|nr:site-2 protease family protein [Candidatus Limnocylindrales bacterium]